MLKYHVAVCDDEKSDLDGIVQSVQQYDVQGCFDIETYMDGNELLSELQMQKKSFDLLLLDIEMPSNGFQLAQSLIQMEKHPLVVFVTKRHEYAVQDMHCIPLPCQTFGSDAVRCGNGCRPSGTELQTFHDRIRWCYHVLGNIGHLLSGKPRT